MEQRDYLEGQIEQLGKVLAVLAEKYHLLKTGAEVELGFEEFRGRLNTELNIDIDALTALPKSKLKNYLEERIQESRQYDLAANFLVLSAEERLQHDRGVAYEYLRAALRVMDLTDERFQTLSFERENRKSTVHELLKL